MCLWQCGTTCGVGRTAHLLNRHGTTWPCHLPAHGFGLVVRTRGWPARERAGLPLSLSYDELDFQAARSRKFKIHDLALKTAPRHTQVAVNDVSSSGVGRVSLHNLCMAWDSYLYRHAGESRSGNSNSGVRCPWCPNNPLSQPATVEQLVAATVHQEAERGDREERSATLQYRRKCSRRRKAYREYGLGIHPPVLR